MKMKYTPGNVVKMVGAFVRLVADEVHDSGGAALVSLAPVAAVVPSAWAIWQATGNALLAFAIESVGFAACYIAVEMWRRDRDRRWMGLIGTYIAITMLLIFGFKTAPVLVDVAATIGDRIGAMASMLMPLLAVVGAVIYAVHRIFSEADRVADEERAAAQAADEAMAAAKLRQWEADQQAKRDRQRIQAEAKAAGRLAQAVPPTVPQDGTRGTPVPSAGHDGPTWWNDLLDAYRDDPHLSARDAAQRIGKGKSTINRAHKAMKEAGLIHVNGNGVEVK